MAHRLAWSSSALADLESIAAYIESDSPAYASAVVTRIVTAARFLSSFPRSGRVVPELDNDNFRELIVHSYRVIYQVREEEIVILTVIHGRQMLESQ